jgi:hypothetical protein
MGKPAPRQFLWSVLLLLLVRSSEMGRCEDHGKSMGKPWENHGKSWKIMGKSCEDHGKSWEIMDHILENSDLMVI